MQNNLYGTVIPSHTLLHCLTNFLPDRCSTGPAIPGGGFPPVRGLPDYESPVPAGRCPLTGRSQSADIALTGLPPTPRNHPATLDIHLPDIPEPLSLHIHSQSRVDKYVRAFTVLLFYVSGLSPYCCSIPI